MPAKVRSRPIPIAAISGLALLIGPALVLAETSVREAKDLYQLNREEVDSGFPVHLRGIITYCRGPEFPEFVMQDKSAGFIAELPHGQETANLLEPGDEIEIEGKTRLSEGLPTRVAVSRFRKTGTQALPAPISISPAAIAGGGGRYSYIEFPGVIRDAQIDTTLQPPRLVLRFGEPQDPLFVRLTGFDETAVAMLVPDTRVLVRGGRARLVDAEPATDRELRGGAGACGDRTALARAAGRGADTGSSCLPDFHPNRSFRSSPATCERQRDVPVAGETDDPPGRGRGHPDPGADASGHPAGRSPECLWFPGI